MKENDNIDKWLRKSTEGFRPEPSGAARERFLSEVPVKGSTGVNGRLYGTLAFALLLSVTAFIWWASDRNDSPADNKMNQNTTIFKQYDKGGKSDNGGAGAGSQQNIVVSSANILETENTEAETNNITAGNTTINEYEDKSTAVTASGNRNSSLTRSNVKSVAESIDKTILKIPVTGNPDNERYSETSVYNTVDNTKTDSSGARQDVIAYDEKSSAINTDILLSEGIPGNNEISAELPVQTNIPNETGSIESEPANINTTEAEAETDNPSTANAKNKEKKVKQGHRFMNQTLSLHYRPEIVWNVIDNEKLIHNFGAEWQTRLFSGNYLLGTGLGASLTRGYYEYAIKYNEFLGNYQQLDSITFNWNPREFSMETTVHTSEETVFDTVIKVNTARVYRDFIYLQIPLTMGYDIVNKPRYSLGIRFAPILSVLLSKKPVDFRYEAGNDRIVQINRITPDRVRTNWQLNAGINYSRRLTNTFWMELEPRFTYYFNSVYEKSDNSSSPMGASIRVAVGIKY